MNKPQDRKLAAILFADIVGYTSLMQKDEATANVSLEKFHSTLSTKVKAHKGQVINNYGDGCVCTFDSAVAAMQCATEVQAIFQTEPKVPVRIGLHSGDVMFKENNVYGDSVNIASRIESLGIPGAVLFSERIKRHISNQTAFEVRSLGAFNFKNVEQPMEVFALANEGFAIPKRAEMKGKLKIASQRKSKLFNSIIISVLLLSLFGFWKFTSTSNTTSIEDTIAANSIAVLPFINMSDEKENQYFTDGMHDDLLTHLSKIGSMKVISRTSILRFKDTEKPIPEIAKELSVANILEGSVRRAGNQIRINVQLIKAETDEHIWSEFYDRELNSNNIFDIQTEIAKQIAAALKTNITTEQKVAMEQRPTDNLEAYEAYLRGRQLVEERVTSSILEAKAYLEKAIELDVEFAQAYVKLGEVYYLLVMYAREDSKTNYALAWDYCKKGKAINDKLAEVYALECTLFHRDKGDIENARLSFEKAIALNPNYADAYYWYSRAIFEIERDSKKALEIIEKAVQLNPLSPKYIDLYGFILAGDQQFRKAKQAYQKAINLNPKFYAPIRNLSAMYAYLGQLDSSAIITFQKLREYPDRRAYLGLYLFILNELDMKPEFDLQLDQFSSDNTMGNGTFLGATMGQALSNGEFDKVKIYRDQLLKLNNDVEGFDPSGELNMYFLSKDFQKAVNIFEQNNPDILTKDYLNNYMFAGYNNLMKLQDGLQKYIYSLIQIGEQEKATLLYEKYKDRITENTNEKGDKNFEILARKYFEIKNLIIEGKDDFAMEEFSRLYDGKIRPGWKFITIDPFFDKFKDDPRYLQVVTSQNLEAARLRKNVREYLKLKD